MTIIKAPKPLGPGMTGLLVLVALFAVPGWMAGHDISPRWAWLVCAGFQVVFCIVVGTGINGRPAGLIIDNRNRVSLSKFQMVAWTILILSAQISAVFARLASGVPSAVEIDIPPQLFAVMGISVTSLVASPLILNAKSGQDAGDGQAEATQTRLGDAGHASIGKVYARDDPGQASWLDMFRGDEVSNAASPDIGKLQKFLITIVLLVGYGGAIWTMFAASHGGSGLSPLPDFGEKMVWLLAASHGGYLAYKAAPHGGSESVASAAPPPADDALG